MYLSETWEKEKGWGKMKGKLPKRYNWEVQMAKRRNRKGRAMSGMVMGVRRGIEIVKKEKVEMEGLMWKVIRLGGKK